MTATAACVIVATGCATGGWTKGDTARHAVLTGTMLIDALQTAKIAREPQRWQEHNPVLGRHPSEDWVAVYFGAAYLLTTLMAIALPPPWRAAWQYVVIGVETACIGNNMSIGLGVGF
jgi:hypothetical protein